YTTLYRCLTTLIKLLSPFIPFLTEEIYQNIVVNVEPCAPESVHHNDWPAEDPALVDKELEQAMDLVLTVSSLGRAVRSSSGIKLRQPLPEAKIVSVRDTIERLRPFVDLIKDELNVRAVILTSEESELMRKELRPLLSVLGRKYGSQLSDILEAISKLDADAAAEKLSKGLLIELEVDGSRVAINPDEIEVRTKPREGYRSAYDKGIVVGLNVTIDEELANEGLAKDIVRRIQNQRKNAGLEIADKIVVYYEGGTRLREVFDVHRDYIAEETLSEAIYESTPPEEAYVENYSLAGETLKIGIIRVNKLQ
ncbi:MAG: DUF5915 domain-containing protein, partial [Candidatus Bathyarchaeia archaeon]